MKLVIAEKHRVAQSLARVIGADKQQDGHLGGGGYERDSEGEDEIQEWSGTLRKRGNHDGCINTKS